MKDGERRRTPELGHTFRCSMVHCACEGTRTFIDRPQELYCTDCYEAIKSIRLKRLVST